MNFMTAEIRTRSNYSAGVSLVFPPKTGTRSIVEWANLNGLKGDVDPDFTNQTVVCLYRNFRNRIASAVVQWLATKGSKSLETIKENWQLVEEYWPQIYNCNTHLIPIQGWVDPKRVDIAIHTDRLNEGMNKLAEQFGFTKFHSHENKTSNELLDYANANITEGMWQQLETDPVYKIEVDARTHWQTLTI